MKKNNSKLALNDVSKILAGTIVLLLFVGLGTQAFAEESDAVTDGSIITESSELATPTALIVPSAATILTGPGDFSGSETVIGFESLGSNTDPDPPTGPIVIGDVTFTEFSSGSGGPGWRLLPGPSFFGTPDPILTDNAGISLIRIDFALPVNRVGMIAGIGPADYEVRFFDESLSLIENVPISVSGTTEGAFAGIESDSIISRVEIVEVSGDNGLVGGLDDLRFEFLGMDAYVAVGDNGDDSPPESGSVSLAEFGDPDLTQLSDSLSDKLTGIAYKQSDGTLWATSEQELYKVDPLTGELLETHDLTGAAFPTNDTIATDLSWDPGSMANRLTVVSWDGTNYMFDILRDDGVANDSMIMAPCNHDIGGTTWVNATHIAWIRDITEDDCDDARGDPALQLVIRDVVRMAPPSLGADVKRYDIPRLYTGLGFKDGDFFGTGDAVTMESTVYKLDCDDVTLTCTDEIVAGENDNAEDVDFGPALDRSIVSPFAIADRPNGSPLPEAPTIGRNEVGSQQMVKDGICIDQQCWTVSSYFHEDFELVQMLSGEHTVSLTILCDRGVQSCSHVGLSTIPIGFFDVNKAIWKVELDNNFGREDWKITKTDPQNMLGDVTFTVQIQDNRYLVVSFTIDFVKPTGDNVVLGVHLWDEIRSLRNFYFNEGIEVMDSYAYPTTQTSYEKSLAAPDVCLAEEESNHRTTCVFVNNLLSEQAKAQEILNQMTSGKLAHNFESMVMQNNNQGFERTWDDIKQCYESTNQDDRSSCSFADKMLLEIAKAESQFNDMTAYHKVKNNFE